MATVSTPALPSQAAMSRRSAVQVPKRPTRGGVAGVSNLVNEIEAGGLTPAGLVINAEAEDSPIQTPKRASSTIVRTDTTTRCRSQHSNSRPLFLAAGVARRVITDSKPPVLS